MQQLIEGLDYHVIDDGGMGDLQSYLSQTSRNAARKAIALADRALSGRKGYAATTAIIMAGLAKDKRALSRLFDDHSDVINRYFEQVDLTAVSRLVGLEDTVAGATSSTLKSALVLSAGIALGVAGLTLFNRNTKRR